MYTHVCVVCVSYLKFYVAYIIAPNNNIATGYNTYIREYIFSGDEGELWYMVLDPCIRGIISGLV